MKAWAFFLLLSCGHVIEVKVLKQIRSRSIQIEGCKRQFIQILRKAAEAIGIHQGKRLGLGFSLSLMAKRWLIASKESF